MSTAERVVERLIAARQLADERASEARASASKEGVPLGRWLIEAGWVSPDVWSEQASSVVGIPFVAAPERDASLESRWPGDFFSRHRSAALKLESGTLLVAVVDPTDRENLDAIESFVRLPVRPVCVPERVVRNGHAGQTARAAPGAALALDEPQSETHLRLLHEMLRGALRRNATDVHLFALDSGTLHARLRVDGLLGETLWQIDASSREPLVNRLRVLAGVDLTQTRLPQDGSFSLDHAGSRIDVRASFVPAHGGTSIVLRLLDRERFTRGGSALTLAGLGVLAPERERIVAALRRPHGLVLIVGPTGSGKSTTLHAALSEAADPARKLVTIEDPVEYGLRDAVQVEVDDRAGLTFAAGLRSILRHDPDRILVGEVRDSETAAIALQAALTGHLVLTTLHATAADDVPERMRALGIEAATVQRALSLLVVQRLVRRTCAACTGTGCAECDRSGYRGRLALTEVREAHEGGLRPLRPVRDLARELVDGGLTTRAELERVWPEALA